MRRWSAFHRTRFTAMVMVLGLGTVTAVPDAGAAGDVELGSADARARVLRVGPSLGGLSAALELGQSLADFAGSVGRGQARSIDLAALGVALGAEGCDGSDPILPAEQQPPTLRVASSDGDDPIEQHLTYLGTPATAAAGLAFGDLTARATDDPSGFARTELGSAGIPGVIEVRGGFSEAETRLLHTADGIAREARATSVVPEIVLADGLVTIRGLRWQALQRTDAHGDVVTSDGSFSIDGIQVAGLAPLGLGGLLQGVAPTTFDAVTGLLEPLGVTLEYPAVDVRPLEFPDQTLEDAVVEVTPLRIAIQDSPAGALLIAPLLDAAQPYREKLLDALLALTCQAGTGILVGDLVLGILAGSGTFDLEIGGVVAQSEGVEFESPFGAAAPVAAPPPAPAPTPEPSVLGRVVEPSPRAVPAPATDDPAELVPAPAIAPAIDLRDGEVANRTTKALAVFGALVLLAVATSDALKLRRERHMA